MSRRPIPFGGIRAVLFDLDGTLADTAPDLAAAVNALRTDRGLPALPLSALRPFASHGARGLVGRAFDIAPGDAGYEALREEFLATYEGALCVESRLFEQVHLVIEALASRAIAWGIVTNKVARFTTPLVERLGFALRPGVVVSGDTTPHTKPHPAPLTHAAAALGVEPSQCIYVGDDLRDIQAGHAAGMATVAAAYGYCADTDPNHWGADALIDSPLALLPLIA